MKHPSISNSRFGNPAGAGRHRSNSLQALPPNRMVRKPGKIVQPKNGSPGIFICAIPLIIALLAYAGRTGNEIKIYATGRDIQSIMDNINFRIAPEFLTLRLVDEESEADVNVTFQEDIGNPNADAVSYTYRGHIYIANSAPADSLSFILLHELLHCSGVGHEPDDPTSIMFTHTHKRGQLNEGHIRNLRRLAGVTVPERLIAQFRALL